MRQIYPKIFYQQNNSRVFLCFFVFVMIKITRICYSFTLSLTTASKAFFVPSYNDGLMIY